MTDKIFISTQNLAKILFLTTSSLCAATYKEKKLGKAKHNGKFRVDGVRDWLEFKYIFYKCRYEYSNLTRWHKYMLKYAKSLKRFEDYIAK